MRCVLRLAIQSRFQDPLEPLLGAQRVEPGIDLDVRQVIGPLAVGLLEVIERPRGGLSLVLADGQRSGKAAKSISNIVARKAIALLAEGVRDGAVARAAHDYLRGIRRGKVSATLNIVSIDMETESLVISRNSHCPTLIVEGENLRVLDEGQPRMSLKGRTDLIVSSLWSTTSASTGTFERRRRRRLSSRPRFSFSARVSPS